MKNFLHTSSQGKLFGRCFEIFLASFIMVAAIGFTSTVHAQALIQRWSSEEFLVVDEGGCAGEDGIAHVLTHLVIARMPRGFWSLHVNSEGTWTGLESGTEARWLYNLTDVFPITPQGSGRDQFVRTEQVRLRIIGEGNNGSFYLRGKLHLTVLDGEPIANFDSVTAVCTVD